MKLPFRSFGKVVYENLVPHVRGGADECDWLIISRATCTKNLTSHDVITTHQMYEQVGQ